jgi:translocation and assembly module TamB
LTEPTPEADPPEVPEDDFIPPAEARWLGHTLRGLVGVFALLLVLVVAARLGVQTDFGRDLVLKSAEGAKLGAFGRLHLEGLSGDILGDFSLRRLQVKDAKGVWLDAQNLDGKWASWELLGRRAHIKSLSASRITILRQPIQTKEPPRPPGGKLPVSIILDQARLRLETRPEFSVKPGLWDVEGRLHLRRSGPADGLIKASSRLRFGDGLAMKFRIGEQDRTELEAEAIEMAGGAMAGALGLPADQPFSVRADADGALQAGKLRLVTRSGADSPLLVDASWGKDGASMDARAKLAMSHWTHMFAERIGPQAQLTLTSHRQHGDVYLVDMILNGPTARGSAHGLVNMKVRRVDNMDLKMAVEDLSKWWVPVPKIGPTRLAGKLTGTLDRFSIKGDVTGEKMEQNGYVLPRFTGPLTFTHVPGDFRAVMDLKGEGGHGEGLLWLLLGQRPTAHLDGGRIKDGRYVFHEMKLDGANIKASGEGGLGVFGHIGFKGQAVVSNIGLGKAGKGTLTGSWEAVEPKGGTVWNLSFLGQGKQLVTGAAELDRLIGPSPKLTGRGTWGERGLTAEHAVLNGAAITADMHGVMDHQGGLNFDVDWSATGPFGVGPVEIAGAAHGSGKVTGRADMPRADLAAELTSIDVGRLTVKPARLNLTFLKADHEVDGLVSIAGASNFGETNAKAAFRFAEDGFEMHDISADAGGAKISGSVTLKDSEPSTADLVFSATPGAFITSGRLNGVVKLSGRGAGATAEVQVDGQNFATPDMAGVVHRLKLSGKGPVSRMPFELLADSNNPVAWKFQGSGVFANLSSPEITLSGAGRIRKADYRLLEPALIHLGEHDKSVRLHVALSGGEAEIDGRQTGDVLNAKARVSAISLQGLTEDYLGNVSGNLLLEGKGAHLTGTVEALLDGARSRDAPSDQALTTKVKGVFADNKLHLDATGSNSTGLQSSLAMDLPIESYAYPFRVAIDRTKPVKGEFAADGELRPLWDLLAGGDRSLSGKVATHGALSGSLNHLRATGDARLTGGQFRDAASGLLLKDLSITAAFNEGEVAVRNLTGSDGRGGSVTGDGTVSLSSDGASTLKLVLNKFQLLDNEVGRAQASGSVTVTRDPAGHAKMAGALSVDRADIAARPPTPSGVVPLTVREIHLAPKEGQDAPAPRQSPLQVEFDVNIKAARGIFVRGKGLDVELSLDSHVGGDSIRPDLTGAARLIRGSYDFSGKRFDFDELGTVYLGPTPETIRLDLTAQREDVSLTAQIKVRGTAAKPEISLTSTPVLPQDEILSRVLFGVSASQLSPFEAAQLASALASLATGGGFDIIGGLRQFTKLDRLSVGVDTTTTALPGVKQATTISGGKYLTDNVYVELTGGGRTGPSAQVEVRIKRNLSVISQVGSQGDARLSVRFRQNYK